MPGIELDEPTPRFYPKKKTKICGTIFNPTKNDGKTQAKTFLPQYPTHRGKKIIHYDQKKPCPIYPSNNSSGAEPANASSSPTALANGVTACNAANLGLQKVRANNDSSGTDVMERTSLDCESISYVHFFFHKDLSLAKQNGIHKTRKTNANTTFTTNQSPELAWHPHGLCTCVSNMYKTKRQHNQNKK